MIIRFIFLYGSYEFEQVKKKMEKIDLVDYFAAHALNGLLANKKIMDKYILDDCYQYTNKKNVYLGSNDYIFRDFIENIGTFRSARLKKLPRTFEFFYECFAQWLLSNGNLKFNDFPKVLKSSNRKAWGKDTGRSYELVDEDLADNYKSDLIYAFENAFRELLESNLDNISIM
jgi:hypothetical protein